MILPLTQLTLARVAGPQRLGRVMGIVGLVGQLAPITGPLLGGLLIDGWGWRWIFFVNVPIVLVSLFMTWRWFPPDEQRSDQARALDLVGLALLPTAVVALLYVLSTLDAGPDAAVRVETLLSGVVANGPGRTADGEQYLPLIAASKEPVINVAIIIGSTRPGRNGEAVARWVYDLAAKRSDARFELVDLKDFDLPHLDEVMPPAMGQYQHPHTRARAEKIASFDASKWP